MPEAPVSLPPQLERPINPVGPTSKPKDAALERVVKKLRKFAKDDNRGGGRKLLEEITVTEDPVDEAEAPPTDTAQIVESADAVDRPEGLIEDPEAAANLDEQPDLVVAEADESHVEQPVEVPIDEEAELAKVKALRAELGLPEKSPLLFEPPTEEEKRAVLEPFYERRLQAKLAEEGGFIDRNKKRMEERRMEGRKIKSGGIRERTLQMLEKAGVADAAGYLAVLDDRALAGDSLASDVKKLMQFRKLGLDPEKLGIAIDRLETLGFEIYGANDFSQALNQRGFGDFLQTFASADQLVFDNLCLELNDNYYLKTGRIVEPRPAKQGGVKLSHSVSFFANILQEGGLSAQLKEGLTQQRKMSLLGAENKIQEKPHHAGWYATEFGGNNLKQDQNSLDIAENLAFQWLREPDIAERAVVFTDEFFRHMEDKKLADPLRQIIQAGIRAPFIDCYSFNSQLHHSDEIGMSLQRAADISSSPAKREWVALIQDLEGNKIISNQRSQDLESLYQNREKIVNRVLTIRGLPKEFREMHHITDQTDINLIARIVKSTDTGDGIEHPWSTDDNKYLQALHVFIQTESGPFATQFIDYNHLPVLAFLARHKTDIGKYVSNYRNVSAPLIEAVAAGDISCTDEAMTFLFDHHIDQWADPTTQTQVSDDIILRYQKVINPDRLTQRLHVMPESAIKESAHLSDQDRKVLITAMKSISPLHVLKNRERFDELFIDGNPTAVFCYEVAKNTEVTSVIAMLENQPEILDTFSQSERQFWNLIIKSTPTNSKGQVIGSFLINNKERFGEFMNGDHINAQFSLEVAKKGGLSELAPLLTSEALALFSEQERRFWEFQKILPQPIIFEHADILISEPVDFVFVTNVIKEIGKDSTDFFAHYVEGLKNGHISYAERDSFFTQYKIFQKTNTTFSPDRLTIYLQEEAQLDTEVLRNIPNEVDRSFFIMDTACYRQRGQTNKLNGIQRLMTSELEPSKKQEAMQFLRWLPDNQIGEADTYESLKLKYQASLDKLGDGFDKLFPDARQIIGTSRSTDHLREQLAELNIRFGIKTRQVMIDGVELALPEDFIREFNKQRHQDPDAKCIPQLSKYFIDQLTRRSTAYTVEDLLYSQIGKTEDTTGRRRGQYTAEQLLEVMEDNIDASLLTWQTAIRYQQEKPESPLFIIANERTGPADVAAEYLPENFANEHGVNQEVDYDSLFPWFKANRERIDAGYGQFVETGEIDAELLQNAREQLGLEGKSIIPIYRIKVPSSLSRAASDEPEGIDMVVSFLKLTSMVGGRTLFMDESTRSAPRSIECMYNVLNRRQGELGGVDLRLFDKIKGATGQNGTLLEEVSLPNSHIEIGFIDPWHSERKSVTDDSVGFVPEVKGKGVVEVIEPSYASINPYGAATIQDFWKQMIAAEVSHRYNRTT